MSKFQNFWLEEIKKKTKASFVGYETYKGNTRLKIVIGGESNYLTLTDGYNGVNIETYAELLKQLDEVDFNTKE